MRFNQRWVLVFAAAISGLAIGFSAIDVILHLANESRNQAIEASQRAVESQLTVANDGDDIPPSGPTTVQQELGMTAGLPYRDPINLNTNTPKNLTINLVAKRTIFNIAGKKVWGESYDGQYIGPTMHFLPGENVTLHFVNDLATATNLHFHGMHLSPSGSSDNPFINVLPGHSFNYDLAIPADQPQGTFWYHDHEMCMGTEAMAMPGMAATNTKIAGCDDLESQIFAGLSGTIIVGDDRALLPTDLRNIPVHTLVFKDLQIDTSDHILQNSNTVAINSNDQTVRLVNGELRPVMTMQPGQTELWRLANEGADIFYNLQLPGYTFTVIGQDGYPSAHVTTVNTLLLPPAKRYDVLVTASKHPGQTWLKTLTYFQGDDTYPTVNLMQLKVSGDLLPSLPLPTGTIPTSHPNLASAPIAQKRTLNLSESADGSVMYINGKNFSMNKSIFGAPAILGTVEQWTILNETTETHPFHIHTDHFQVMSTNGLSQPYIGEQDIVTVPPKKDGIPGKVVIRIAFTDFLGRVMFHCHIAAHEDAGMMSFINVVKG